MASRTTLSLVLGFALLGTGCLSPAQVRVPRVSELSDVGDARFRASQRLVVEGLDADTRGDWTQARSRYERALQVDSSNPWAYLALARQHLEAGEGRRALRHAERAAALFESLEQESPGALVHCDGIRGAALALQGRHTEAERLLRHAARQAPRVWGDGRLTAAELR